MPLRIGVICFLCTILWACSTLEQAPQNAQNFQFVSPNQSDWAATGKFSFRGPDGRENGQFIWTQTGENYHLRLFGPLGIGGAEVASGPESAKVVVDGNEYLGDDSTPLLYQLTGIWIPVSDLGNLLLGKETLVSRDWQVSYQRAAAQGSYLLPELLEVNYSQYELRIFIDRWTF